MKKMITDTQCRELLQKIDIWSEELGFQQLGISDVDLHDDEIRLLEWVDQDYHGEMSYMENHGTKRSRPDDLVSGTLSIISVRMNYLPPDCADSETTLKDDLKAFVSRYALGRDYHKVMRNRLQKLATKIEQMIGDFGYRVFVDSAPVLEKAIARKAGLGWIGKHTNLINRDAGSWFFLGEIYTDIPLSPNNQSEEDHCGTCTACIDVCPTRAIVAPYKLDARRCISYLTIELKGTIPTEFRKAIGNRIYGCDDCQIVCPWNKFSAISKEKDFSTRHKLDAPRLTELFSWDEATFLKNTEGSAIRRIGYMRWLRNIAIAMGNARYTKQILQKLEHKKTVIDDEIVLEHIDWAIDQQMKKCEM